MNNITKAMTLVALTQFEAKDARKTLKPGTYHLDEVVRVKGEFTISEDYLKTPTASIPLLETLALALKFAGITGPAAENAIINAVTEAIENKEKVGEVLKENHPEIAKRVETLKKTLAAKLPKVKASGPINSEVTVTVMEEAELVTA